VLESHRMTNAAVIKFDRARGLFFTNRAKRSKILADPNGYTNKGSSFERNINIVIFEFVNGVINAAENEVKISVLLITKLKGEYAYILLD